jgi:hypothetical protein
MLPELAMAGGAAKILTSKVPARAAVGGSVR